jgi:predicted nucleic acid-binding protein
VGARTGFDTGVFVLMAGNDPEAVRLWDEAASGDREVLVSALSLFELYRLGLRGALPREFAEAVLVNVPQVCRVLWIEDLEHIRSGAALSQGLGLSLADSLILSSLVERECLEIYTTDSDLKRYQRKGVEIILLTLP